jgi:hypothetical protein
MNGLVNDFEIQSFIYDGLFLNIHFLIFFFSRLFNSYMAIKCISRRKEKKRKEKGKDGYLKRHLRRKY